MITIYSKDNCTWCDRAKELMNTKNEPYTEVKIGRDMTREEFMEQFPNVRSVPFFKTESGLQFATFEEFKTFVDNPVRHSAVGDI